MTDVIIIGAGAAGLAAAGVLSASGIQVIVLEARDRIGGRIFTRHGDLPIELGAEFIHGKPREIFDLMRKFQLLFYDVTERHWFMNDGLLKKSDEYWTDLKQITEAMKDVGVKDLSFKEFLDRHNYSTSTKELAALFIEGFHASSIDQIGIRGLIKAQEAADEIDGDSSFRAFGGYHSIIDRFYERALSQGTIFHFETVVEEIRWRANEVEIAAQTKNGSNQFNANRALITLPLGVLQSGKILFTPSVKEQAIQNLVMGQVVKINLDFREAFWEELKLRADHDEENPFNLGFIHAPNARFPTWWTQLPLRTTLLTGWAGGSKAEKMLGKNDGQILEFALDSLKLIFGIPHNRIYDQLCAVYFHNWQVDPFTLGAYSYVPVNSLQAQVELARPVENTLFFAGEATNTEGHLGTVHGAIASGVRAANQILPLMS
jgi:monoamine oxidase